MGLCGPRAGRQTSPETSNWQGGGTKGRTWKAPFRREADCKSGKGLLFHLSNLSVLTHVKAEPLMRHYASEWRLGGCVLIALVECSDFLSKLWG